VELRAEEAEQQGATVEFSQPLAFYLENFLGMEAGTAVPVGVYDPKQAAWVPSTDGKVVQIVGVTGGLADLDLTGDGQPDDPQPLGIGPEERAELASRYPVGQGLWRVPVAHFSSYDCNFGEGPPPDGNEPDPENPTNGDPESCPNQIRGSIIEAQNQVLSESVRITGTPFSLVYRSDRAPGRTASDTLRIPLHKGTLPAPLKRIELEVAIAGQVFTQSFPVSPLPPSEYEYVWDHKDAYGRLLQGRHPVTVRIGYVYDGYYLMPPFFGNSFGFANGTPLPGNIPTRREVTLWKDWSGFLGLWDAQAQGLGGWSLSAHHVYDPVGKILHLGSGGQRSTKLVPQVILTVAGGGQGPSCQDNGIQATEACLGGPSGVAVAANGSLYIADRDSHTVRRVDPGGTIVTVAGTPGSSGFGGDEGPATSALLAGPEDLDIGPDGSLYIADTGNNRIRRVALDGIIHTVVGGGSPPDGLGDGEQATEARLNGPFDVAVAGDGTLYVADRFNHRIRRIAPDGIIRTVAGGGSPPQGQIGDGGPATEAALDSPEGVTLGRDGSLYIADTFHHRVRRVGPDGVIATFAGGGTQPPGQIGDGGPSTGAVLDFPRRVALGTDGSLYIADDNNLRIRRVGPDGIITTAAGNGENAISGPLGDEGPPLQARFTEVRGMVLGPDGSIYIADLGTLRVRRIDPFLPGFTTADKLIPSVDAGEIYVFSPQGRHLRTLDALTASLKLEFTYDSAGRLASVRDADNNTTTIVRTGGVPTEILGPYGHLTAMELNPAAQGWFTKIIDPEARAHEFDYEPGKPGLMSLMIDPNGGLYTFDYDPKGRLIRDEDPATGFLTLSRTLDPLGYTVTLQTAEGRTRSYQVQNLPDGSQERINTLPSSLQIHSLLRKDGSGTSLTPDGMFASQRLGPDPRFGMQAPISASLVLTTPGGLNLNLSAIRSATLSDPDDVLSLTTQTETATVNGRTFTAVFEFDGLLRTITTTSAANPGRQSVTTLDQRGRIVKQHVPALLDVQFAYDTRGRLDTITRGTRVVDLDYDTSGRVAQIENPLQQTESFEYDLSDRLTKTTLPDGRQILYTYDDNGNVTSVTPPSRPAHSFTHTPVDLAETYTPPQVGPSQDVTLYTYNLDRQVTRIDRPDGAIINLGYDTAGRLETLTTPLRQVVFGYNAITGLLSTVTAPGATLSYGFDGGLMTSETWTRVFAEWAHLRLGFTPR
jgi:YD repeat-containing protein